MSISPLTLNEAILKRWVSQPDYQFPSPRAEPACGDAVLTKKPVEDFQIIRPGKIERPPLPAQEGLDRVAVFFRLWVGLGTEARR